MRRCQMNSLGFITTTIGRKTLSRLVETFQAEAKNCDRLLVLGDGWDAWKDPRDDPRVIFVAKPKGGPYGYNHRGDALRAQTLTTDYIDMIDDDDEFIPGQLDYLRELTESYYMVEYFPLCPDSKGQAVSSRDTYLRYMIRNKSTWESFGESGHSDGWFYLAEADKALRDARDIIAQGKRPPDWPLCIKAEKPIIKCKVYQWSKEVTQNG